MIRLYSKKDTGKLHSHFNIREFHCHCKCPTCHFTLLDPNLLDALTSFRIEISNPLFLTSAFRCQAHNKKVGGVEHSKHTMGKAVDMLRPANWPWDIFIEVANERFDKVIPYKAHNFIHCSII